jgi:hypothetical protein
LANHLLAGGPTVKKGSFKQIGCVAVIIILATSVLGFAAEGDKIRVQGQVMESDLKQMVIIVNEKTFSLDINTVVCNEKGSPIPNDRLKAKAWVYIVAENDRVRKRLVAQKIYLLSKRIPNKEKHLYPFMQETETPPED